MKALPLLPLVLLTACADEEGIVLCVEADGWQEGDEMQLEVTFAASDQGPTCNVLPRVAQPLPFCVSATRGDRYGYAMALRAVWSRTGDEVGRRVAVVPYADEQLVEADLVVDDCCAPADDVHECRGGACEEIAPGVTDFFGDLVDGVDCER